MHVGDKPLRRRSSAEVARVGKLWTAKKWERL